MVIWVTILSVTNLIAIALIRRLWRDLSVIKCYTYSASDTLHAWEVRLRMIEGRLPEEEEEEEKL